MSMLAIQLICIAILSLYLVLRLKDESDKRGFGLRFSLLTLASWIAENTCIHLYEFYSYNPEWLCFIDQVPLLIVLIWPVVIQSATDLFTWQPEIAQRAWWKVAGFVALIVLADASLIEPIAVQAGLWRWYQPGIFHVPVIGIIGWSIFTFVGVAHLRSRISPWLVLLLAPLGVHLGLLALWWGLFRHINHPIPDWACVAFAACVALVVLVRGLMSKAPAPPPRLLLLRAPGALFFFVLLVMYALTNPALSVYAVCFALPWMAFVWKGLRHGVTHSP